MEPQSQVKGGNAATGDGYQGLQLGRGIATATSGLYSVTSPQECVGFNCRGPVDRMTKAFCYSISTSKMVGTWPCRRMTTCGYVFAMGGVTFPVVCF